MLPKNYIKYGDYLTKLGRVLKRNPFLFFGGVLLKAYSVYQPILDLKNNQILGYEALLRGPKPPDVLFSEATSSENIFELDLMAQNCALSSYQSDKPLFLNIHPYSFSKGLKIDFTSFGINPSQIVLELTEQVAIENIQYIAKEYKRMGMKIAIDDFGKGYNNLSLIELLEPEYIKLDKTLIQNYHSENIFHIISGIQAIANNIGSNVIAEGIEEMQQLQFVQSCGIKYGQGWLFGKPKKAESLQKDIPLFLEMKPSML